MHESERFWSYPTPIDPPTVLPPPVLSDICEALFSDLKIDTPAVGVPPPAGNVT